MAAVLLFWDTNMAAVTSCENTLFIILAPSRRVDSIKISLSRDLRARTLACFYARIFKFYAITNSHMAALPKRRSFTCNYQRLTYHFLYFSK